MEQAGGWIVVDDGKCVLSDTRPDALVHVASTMGRYAKFAKQVICLWILFAKNSSSLESIYEKRFAPYPLEFKKMEEL